MVYVCETDLFGFRERLFWTTGLGLGFSYQYRGHDKMADLLWGRITLE